MGGKSTYICQTALITLLTYIGSFVPAKNVCLGTIDRIFTHIGVSDNLVSVQLTFIAEMIETATILHNTTEKSLILMDEMDCVASIFYGFSLAYSCASHLAMQLKASTLFATHYFELTILTETLPAVYNVKNYGLHIAKLAGVQCPLLLILSKNNVNFRWLILS